MDMVRSCTVTPDFQGLRDPTSETSINRADHLRTTDVRWRALNAVRRQAYFGALGSS
jgi:hypothetical protein